MNGSRSVWWPLHRGKDRLSREPGAALFQGLRFRLTLWYCGVLGAALVLFGVALYFGAQYFLLHPIESKAAAHAQEHEHEWLSDSPVRACPSFGPIGQFGSPPGQGFQMPELVVCFDQNGSLLPGENTAGLPSAFLTNTLAKSALETGRPVHDIVNVGGTVGQIYRYAVVVPNPTGSGNAGVVLVGEIVQAQVATLSLLLTLLLSIGGVALLGAGLGGLFLANRALAPARLAWTHQQRFIADAAHELRTPLTLLRADAEVLLRSREHLAAEDGALLEDIVAEANHMSILANNMLTLARLDNGSSHREHEVVNLADVAIMGARRIRALADQTEISIEVLPLRLTEPEANCHPHPHPHPVRGTGNRGTGNSSVVNRNTEVAPDDTVLVIGDPTLLEQAVLALLDNAIKYNRRGGHVTVRTYTKQGQALLEVRDTGIGIAAEHLSHLGERFYRVDKARSREAGGTGLGLSIARSIAIAHGGTLTLTSIPDQGTTVTLMLPLAHRTSRGREHDALDSVSSLPESTM